MMASSAVPQAKIDEAIFVDFPSYRACVVYAAGVTNGPSDDRSRSSLRAAQHAAIERLGGRRVAEHPHVAAWRDAYAKFGSKPSRYHCSMEALIRRALKDEVPSISRLVDLYNAVSMNHFLPIGREDRDRLLDDNVLRYAEGVEVFEPSDGPATVVGQGEVIWCDSAGVTCRRWNWRQGSRTALTDGTRNAYFVLDSMQLSADSTLLGAVESLVDGLRDLSPQCRIEVDLSSAATANAYGPDGLPSRSSCDVNL